MKHIAFIGLVLLSGCAVKLPGTRDAQVEQVRLLTHAIEKQSDALVAIATSRAVPSPTPSPTPEEIQEKPVSDHFGEEPAAVIAVHRIK
jgi:hypothetical protein